MKTYKLYLAAMAALGLSALSTQAIPITPINITLSLPLNGSSVLVNDIDANDLSSFGTGKSGSADLGWLQQDVHWYDLNYSGSLAAPTLGQTGTSENLSGGITVSAGDYLVLHYGSGPGGDQGGGAVALYFDTSGTYKIPRNGAGPDGYGGISYAELFGPNSVPDACSTALLLGGAVSAIGLVRRKLR